jgi:hypothetical protein
MNRKSALKARESGNGPAGKNGFKWLCILYLERVKSIFPGFDFLCFVLKSVTINIFFRCDVILAK